MALENIGEDERAVRDECALVDGAHIGSRQRGMRLSEERGDTPGSALDQMAARHVLPRQRANGSSFLEPVLHDERLAKLGGRRLVQFPPQPLVTLKTRENGLLRKNVLGRHETAKIALVEPGG